MTVTMITLRDHFFFHLSKNNLLRRFFKNLTVMLVMVAHAFSPSILGGRGRPALQNEF